jgi:hypothetical protein
VGGEQGDKKFEWARLLGWRRDIKEDGCERSKYKEENQHEYSVLKEKICIQFHYIRLSALVILQIRPLKGIFLSCHHDFTTVQYQFSPHPSSPTSRTSYQPPSTGPTCHTLPFYLTPPHPIPGAFLPSFSPPPTPAPLPGTYATRSSWAATSVEAGWPEGRGGGVAALAPPPCSTAPARPDRAARGPDRGRRRCPPLPHRRGDRRQCGGGGGSTPPL